MKKYLFTLLSVLSFIPGYSQEFKDLIVTKSNDSIHCTITLKNDNNFFYDHKVKKEVVNDMMSANDVKSYVYAGGKQIAVKTIVKDTTTKKDYARTKYVYCEIVGTAKFFSDQVTINIDYGQEKGYWEQDRIKDDNGKVKLFNSMIDALNFMGDQGWEFVQAYAVTEGNTGKVYHYLLKRSK
jgi:hypothetical protein